MIVRIERSIVWEGRAAGGKTWFHPRPCRIPGQPKPTILMTCQLITGSDVFHQVHWTTTADLGGAWAEPLPVRAFGRGELEGGIEEGVCDVVPDYHARTGTVLAMGHNVYYRNGKLTQPSTGRFPVYAVLGTDGQWSPRQRLEWDDPRAGAIYTSGCGQRLILADGDLLVPLSFGPKGRRDRAVGTALCSFDGQTLTIRRTTRVELRNQAGRGLLEPSLARANGRFYLTIRAEDGRGYVAVSDDGLTWREMKPWAWQDGTPLDMSTTQQHWVTHGDGLFLAYTRKASHNPNVIRWRAPLFVARVDPERTCLVRESEQEVFPLIGDGVKAPEHVALMGNFHVVNATEEETWLTVGETLPKDGWRGNTLLARIIWRKPNRLVTE